MPFNGSGTFNVFTPGNPISNGQTSDAVLFNNTISDLESRLSNTLTKDGQTPATANIPMGNHKITGLAAATTSGDAVRYDEAITMANIASQTVSAAITATNATTATNIAGGSAGTIPYQSASGTTAMLAAGTAGQSLISGGAGAPTWGGLTQATAQAATSGTSIDFTGIPNWAKRITITLVNVSTNGTSLPMIRIGSGSVSTSGYICQLAAILGGNITSLTTATDGFRFNGSSLAVGTILGTAVLTLTSSNTWTYSANVADTGDNRVLLTNGNITLGGALDRVRLTTVNGTDTFDAGSINIMYE